MRFAAPAWIALALTAGCMRFGYGSEPRKLDGGFDSGSSRPDGSLAARDAAADGGDVMDGGGMDAAIGGDAAAADAGNLPSSGGGSGSLALDAGRMLDAGTQDAAAADTGTVDAGMPDSGMIDSGMIDSGTTGSEVDPLWTVDCPGIPGVLFCDDFEDGLTKWSYPVHIRGTTDVTTDYRRTTGYSMRANTSSSTATVQSAARRGVKAFAHRKSGDLWARYYYYLPSWVTLTEKLSSGVISEYEEPFMGFSVTIFPDGVGIESQSISRKVTTTTFPRNQWVCVEMHVQIDASAGKLEFFMNGSQVTSLIGLDTLPDQGYTSFEVGVHYANFNQGAITVYTDDVMLGTSRLGCN
jgi:hypothetical protein